MSYSIEILFSYKDLTDSEIAYNFNIVSEELNELANSLNGELMAWDEDIGFSSSGIKKFGINHNFQFVTYDDANNFILRLPTKFTIKWVYKYKNKQIDYVIYSSNNKPETIKFDNDDKVLYKNILNKIKN